MGVSTTFSKQKKRILMVGPLPPTVGGITTFITSILDSDLNEKYKLITFGTERPTFGIPRSVSDYTEMLRMGLVCLVKSVVWTLSHLLTFPFLLLKNCPDIIHVHTASYWSFWENAMYIIISEMLSKKTVLHIHGGGFEKFYKNSNRLIKFLIAKILNLPDKVIVLSRSWKRFFANFFGENKIAILENFVNSSRYSGFKGEKNFPKDTITVLFVGGVGAEKKGLYDVLRAMPLVIRRCKNILFFFVACSILKELSALCEKEEISSHARFFGYLVGDEKIKVFTESDIFVLPSYAEGLPITILEAMAAGLPIIATAVGAIPEIIEDGKNGYIIEPGDYRALADGIVRLAENEELRHKIGKNNIDTIRKHYDRAVIVRKLDNLYTQLLRA